MVCQQGWQNYPISLCKDLLLSARIRSLRQVVQAQYGSAQVIGCKFSTTKQLTDMVHIEQGWDPGQCSAGQFWSLSCGV